MKMEPYEVYAIKYAELKDRPARDIFLSADLHEAPVDMDYYVWLLRNSERSILVDTGFNLSTAEMRGRCFVRCPGDGLRVLGEDPARLTDIIITHLHYDHVGNFDLFPNATFHMQDQEVSYATGRYMTHEVLRAPYALEDVLEVVRRVYAGRVTFHDGESTVAPGVSVHLVPGHSAGLQCVRVHTRKGWLVLASDACHYNRHRLTKDIFPIVFNVGDLLENYRKLAQLASDEALIIPGHDPDVLRDFPAVASDPDGLSARLD